MTVTVINENDCTRVVLDGMLDTASSSEFQSRVEPLLKKDRINLLVDLTDLVYVSSQGIRTLLTLIKTIMNKDGSTLKFNGIRPAVMEILDMSGISEVMTII